MIKIYKTNIENAKKKNRIADILNNITGPKFWNIDLEDSDKILRVDATRQKVKQVESLLRMAGFYYEELPYQL
ncbi:hypothetical protein SAMN05216490_3536 [Mucilaginibacter mallensis]|uniref:HMA domain-containing protein n=1 Tax=Mucilaginibacter mallensis TaxID=652787 RepID=A0A1H2AHP8_MUCMA|nr:MULTISPECIES: hypothetical protein [Mucilaginibacter]MBB6142029.1 hypothetical protein [Mucilaginibacter sp. X5P1]SDT45282.1 hypothetical protein SAMN05216490_3536 [Mucilaginibacter mallensis]